MTDLVRHGAWPRRVVATVDDVLDPFDACSDGEGFAATDCRAISPDGGHTCFDDRDDHGPEHWCRCDDTPTWPLDDASAWPVDEDSRPPPREYIDVGHLGTLRTPEADRTDRDEPPWVRAAIGQSIAQVEDPALRRAFREEYHRS